VSVFSQHPLVLRALFFHRANFTFSHRHPLKRQHLVSNAMIPMLRHRRVILSVENSQSAHTHAHNHHRSKHITRQFTKHNLLSTRSRSCASQNARTTWSSLRETRQWRGRGGGGKEERHGTSHNTQLAVSRRREIDAISPCRLASASTTCTRRSSMRCRARAAPATGDRSTQHARHTQHTDAAKSRNRLTRRSFSICSRQLDN
jgi:hypothetical protein